MLDKSLVGTTDNHKFLQCEYCGIKYYKDELPLDYESIDDTGICTTCADEERHTDQRDIEEASRGEY